MNQIATIQKRSLVDSMAARYDMEPTAFVNAIKATVIKGECSNEQFAAFLMVAKEYKLNPLTKEIYAFPDRGGIQPIVSIDGWMNLINSHPQFDGMEFQDTHGEDGKVASVECRIFRKDRSRHVSVIEYMSECSRPTEPWKKWPNRMLRHKAAIQAARYAFGFSGIMEPDEYDRMKDVTPAQSQVIVDPLSDEPIAAHEHVTEDGEIITAEYEDMHVSTPPADNAEGVDQLVDNGHTLTQTNDENETGAIDQLSDEERSALKSYIIQCKNSVGPDASVIVNIAKGHNDHGTFKSQLARDKAGTITRSFKSVCEGKADLDAAINYTCGLAGIDAAELDEAQP